MLRWLAGNCSPFESKAASSGHDVLCRATVNQSDVQCCAGRIECVMPVVTYSRGDFLYGRDQASGTHDRRRAEVWISAVCFAAMDRDLCQRVALAGAHWLQRSWFADNRVARGERLCGDQPLRAEAAYLFVRG